MKLKCLSPLGSVACHLALAAFAITPAPSRAAETRPLTSADTFLAIDASVFDKVEGMSVGTCEAKRYEGNPILANRPGGPDSVRAGFSGNVILDNGKFRMWYMAGDGKGYRTAYAESDDGRNWTRPNLGLFPYNGADSNIVYNEMGVLVPFRDDAEPDPQRRYKTAIYGHITDQYFNDDQKKRYGKGQPSVRGFAYSPDGLRWTLDTSNPYPVHAKLENAVLFRMQDRFLMVCQMNVREYPQVEPFSRYLGVAFSDDNMKTWRLADDPAFYFDKKYGGVIQTHIAPSYLNYGNVVVGAVGLFQNHAELIDQQADLITVLTNDGLHWRQPYPQQPLSYLLRRGQPGAWDAHFNVQLGLVDAGRQTLLFYAGKPDGGNTPTGGHQVGLAELRLDGYGYLAPSVGWNYSKTTFTGLLLSKPIRLAEKGLGLYLNTTGAREGDVLKVELQDETGQPIPGFTLAECQNLTGDSVGEPVTWNGNASLDALANRSVRVKIAIEAANADRSLAARMKAPHLYGFYFDRPTLWLKGSQAVLPGRGLERVHYQDSLLPRLRGIHLDADRPVDVGGRRVDDLHTELEFSGDAQVTLRWPDAATCSVDGQDIPLTGGAFSFEARAGRKVVLTRGAVADGAK